MIIETKSEISKIRKGIHMLLMCMYNVEGGNRCKSSVKESAT
jgi:hypothetical protein